MIRCRLAARASRLLRKISVTLTAAGENLEGEGKKDKRMEEEMLRATWLAWHSLFERWKVGVDGYAAEVVDEGQVL